MAKREYPDAPFPVERLLIDSAKLTAYAHKNPYNPLHVDWCFGISFMPLTIAGTEYMTSLVVEIETPDARRLEDFNGLIRHDTKEDFNIGSFYLFDCRPSVDTHFRVNSVRGNTLDVEMSIKADLGESYIDPDPVMSIVRVRTSMEFSGFSIGSYGVQCAKDRDAVMKVVESLIDPGALRSAAGYRGFVWAGARKLVVPGTIIRESSGNFA